MIDWISDVVAAGGLAGVLLLAFLENIFPPLPSEVILPLAGFAAARGQMALGWVIVAGTLGTVLGNAVLYEVARRIPAETLRRLVDRFGRWVWMSRDDLMEAERFLHRHGPWAIFLARLLPGARTLISIPAGIIDIRRSVFYGWTTLGSAVWVSVLAWAGWVLQGQYERIGPWLEKFGIAAAVAGALGYALWRWRRRAAR
jgi:membrane protein DedA with SNARE-associated domain